MEEIVHIISNYPTGGNEKRSEKSKEPEEDPLEKTIRPGRTPIPKEPPKGFQQDPK